jgi:tripartite-type tricarboxylate transporter receptor subunit TctC
LLAVATLTGANAADFPVKDKPITIVVPFAAGGPTDRVARDLAEAMRKPLGANVVVENVAGAGGTIGANKVAKAPQDGHTVLLHHIGMATSPALYRKMPYNTTEDFEYLGMVNDVPMTLIGRPTLPANTYKELTTWIEQNKGKINLGNAGLGAASHLCGLLFQSAIKTDMLAQLPQDKIAQVIAGLPIPRFAEPDDILNVVDFLASERSSYITAQTIYLGGVN